MKKLVVIVATVCIAHAGGENKADRMECWKYRSDSFMFLVQNDKKKSAAPDESRKPKWIILCSKKTSRQEKALFMMLEYGRTTYLQNRIDCHRGIGGELLCSIDKGAGGRFSLDAEKI